MSIQAYAKGAMKTNTSVKRFCARTIAAVACLCGIAAAGIVNVEEDELRALSDSIHYTTISLESVANRNFKDDVAGDGKGGWSDQGENSVYGFPLGRRKFKGIPFHISQSDGKQCLVMRGQNDQNLPTSAEVMVDEKGKTVYFMHAIAWAAPVVGTYTVNYANGGSHDITVRNKLEVFDFWSPGASETARQIWSGSNPQKEGIGLTVFAWENPKPDKVIESITIQTPGDKAYVMVCGITLSNGPAYLPKEPIRTFVGDTWFPYSGINVEERRGTALDMSKALDAPAGKKGWLSKDRGDFQFENGENIRFWGMSVSDQANFPSKEQAAFMAEYVAQTGMNMIRHHAWDAVVWSPGNNIFGMGTSTREIDSAQLDKLDYFIYQLQERGVYQYFDLICYRPALAADGVQYPDSITQGYKLVGEFDPHLLELQEEFIEQLFNHRNPYTGKTYGEDPALAMLEINNESSLFFMGHWTSWKLRSPYHRDLLQKLYNEWLAGQYDSREQLAEAWQPAPGQHGRAGLKDNEDFAAKTVEPIWDLTLESKQLPALSKARIRDNMRFYYDVHLNYFRRMEKAIRKTGYQGLIAGSNHWTDVAADVFVNSVMDYLDRHEYFGQLMNGYGVEAGVGFKGKSMLHDSSAFLIGKLASRRVKDMPFIVTEWGHCEISGYRHEGIFAMAAYSAFQNWSALQYGLGGKPFDQDHLEMSRLAGVYDIANHPGIMALHPATYLMVTRGDVAEASSEWFLPICDDDALDPRTRLGRSEQSNKGDEENLVSTVDIWRVHRGALAAKSGIVFNGAEKLEPQWVDAFEETVGKVTTSSTGELTFNYEQGLLRVDAPKSQGFAGFARNSMQTCGNVRATVENEHCCFLVTAIDNKPISQSRRLLVTAVGNSANTGMTASKGVNVIKDPGKAPIMVEPVIGEVNLTNMSSDCSRANVFALNPSGRRVLKIATKTDAQSLSFSMKHDYQVMHYEIVIQ